MNAWPRSWGKRVGEIAIYEDRCTQSDPGELPHGQTTSLSEYALATKRRRLLFIKLIFPSSAFITEFDFLDPDNIFVRICVHHQEQIHAPQLGWGNYVWLFGYWNAASLFCILSPPSPSTFSILSMWDHHQGDDDEECDRLPPLDFLGPFRGLLDPVYTSAWWVADGQLFASQTNRVRKSNDMTECISQVSLELYLESKDNWLYDFHKGKTPEGRLLKTFLVNIHTFLTHMEGSTPEFCGFGTKFP